MDSTISHTAEQAAAPAMGGAVHRVLISDLPEREQLRLSRLACDPTIPPEHIEHLKQNAVVRHKWAQQAA